MWSGEENTHKIVCLLAVIFVAEDLGYDFVAEGREL